MNTKDNLGKFDVKSYEAIFVGYSNTNRAYRVFDRITLTTKEPTHVKFEKPNSLVKNIIEIDSLGEDLEKISLKDSPNKKMKSQKKMNMVKFKILK